MERYEKYGYDGLFDRRPSHAFVRLPGRDLGRIFSPQHERVVNRDNTVSVGNRLLQIEKTLWQGTLAGCRVTVCEHLEGTPSYGPQVVGRYSVEGASALRRHSLAHPKLRENLDRVGLSLDSREPAGLDVRVNNHEPNHLLWMPGAQIPAA